MILLPLGAFVLIYCAIRSFGYPRESYYRAVVGFGLCLLATTEILGAASAIRQKTLAVAWMLVCLVAGSVAFSRRRDPCWRRGIRLNELDPVVVLSAIAVTLIVTLTAIAAGFSPPNSADAMAYHMPRVLYWAEQSSVRFFPTSYLNQVMLQPFAEYCFLHAYVLSGTDAYTNFAQWLACIVSISVVAGIAHHFGTNARGQAMAALFCSTLPAGILASSGAKNDYVVAMWLALAIYFGFQLSESRLWVDAVLCGAAFGLALLTKATAYIFAPWFLAAIILMRFRCASKRFWIRSILCVSICAVMVNMPFYWRNWQLSGSPIGFDSAQGDGFFRWRNETIGWKPTVSNLLRNGSEQLATGSESWNRAVYDFVVNLHRLLRIDLNDIRTTWRWSSYRPPRRANHEADAPNPAHLALLAIVCPVLILRLRHRPSREMLYYACCAFCAAVSFCAYLKWQPFAARLFLPLLVICSPLVIALVPGHPNSPLVSRRLGTFALLCVCLVLLDGAKRPTLDNWVRPLRGERSVLRVPRMKQYFSDMTQWRNQFMYEGIVRAWTVDKSCRVIGIDIADFQLEYPLQIMMRQIDANVLFVHSGVDNSSNRFPPSVDSEPCAIVCLGCAGDLARTTLYRRFADARTIGSFILFTNASAQIQHR